MKGIVFTEFTGFVAERYGEDAVDDIIDDAALPSGGAYTTVGTYDHAEMIGLCQALSRRTGEPVDGLVRAFGGRLGETFARSSPESFSRSSHFFDFLESIEAHIHKEVRKLYPDAELPTFTVHARDACRMVLDYRSPRRMAALADGLIRSTAGKFGVAVSVRTEPLDAGDGQAVRFVIDLH